MPQFDTPYGPVDAPDQSAVDKYVAKQKAAGALGKPAGGQTAPQAQSPQPSKLDALWQGLLRGGRDVFEGGAQMGARMLREPGAGTPDVPMAAPGPDLTKEVDQATRQSNQQFEQNPSVRAHPLIAGGGRIAGNAAATAPMAMLGGGGVPSAAGMIGRGAAMGAAGAMMSPVTQGDYWSEKAKQVGTGSLAGAALPAAGNALARNLPSPQNIAKAFPWVRDFFTGAEERTPAGFNRTVARQVLDPIGGTVDRSLSGHKLNSAIEDQIGNAYAKVLPNLSLSREGVARAISPELREFIGELDPLEGKQFETFVTNKLINKFPESGIMPGEVYKKVQSDFSSRAASFLGTQKGDLGKALLHTIGELNDVLAEENPQFAGDLRRVNESFKMWARMREAAGQPTGHGKFMPSDLLQAIKNQDQTSGNAAFAKGDAVLQGFAEAADKAMAGRAGSPMDLLHLFSRHGLPMEVARSVAQPAGRAMKAASGPAAGAIGQAAARRAKSSEHDVAPPGAP